MRKPIIGEKIYIPTSLYIGHGEDDVAGGLVTVKKINISNHLPEGHCNSIMIEVNEVKGHGYNWKVLLEHQEEYKERYGNQIAHNDPDYHDYGGW